jgi:HD-like signal output (HDOD) protein
MKLARSETLPVIPVAVLKLLRLFGEENVSSRELANTIGEDAGLATKILKVASSPVFGTGNCENIPRAIGLIGINRMKQIAVTLGYEQFSQEKTQAPAFDKIYFMEHCKVTASVAREIMAIVNRSKQDNAYMAGLIHDVGFLAMEKHAPEYLNQSILVARARKISILDAQRQTCQFTHQEVSTELAKLWKLTPYIQDAIAFQDCPESSVIDSEMCFVLAAAVAVAYEMGYPPIKGIQANYTSAQYMPLINVSNDQMSEVVERAKVEFGCDSKVAA